MRYHRRISIFSIFTFLGWLILPLLAWGMDNKTAPADANGNLSSQGKDVKLPQPPLLDFRTLGENDDVRVVIYNTQHKFASDAALSGTDIKKQPIFGTRVYINGKKFSESSFGLPFMRFFQGSSPKITYENQTKFTFNIHYHGLNTVGIVDGASM